VKKQSGSRDVPQEPLSLPGVFTRGVVAACRTALLYFIFVLSRPPVSAFRCRARSHGFRALVVDFYDRDGPAWLPRRVARRDSRVPESMLLRLGRSSFTICWAASCRCLRGRECGSAIRNRSRGRIEGKVFFPGTGPLPSPTAAPANRESGDHERRGDEDVFPPDSVGEAYRLGRQARFLVEQEITHPCPSPVSTAIPHWL